MSDDANREKAREIHGRIGGGCPPRDAADDSLDCADCSLIAAALDAAEARGRNQASQSEQHRTSYNIAFEEGRAEGERIGREKGLEERKLLNAIIEAQQRLLTAYRLNNNRLGVSAVDALERARRDLDALQRGAAGEEK